MREVTDALARRCPWLVRGMVLACAGALIATSPPPRYSYEYEKTESGPDFSLDAQVPRRTYRISIRATDLAPNGRPTTGPSARNFIAGSGRIRSEGVPDGAGFVVVRVLGPDGEPRGSNVTALSSFSLATEPSFVGDCEQPAAGTCEAEFFVDFARLDGGERGGTMNVQWAVVAEASVDAGEKSPASTPEMPWTIAITEQ